MRTKAKMLESLSRLESVAVIEGFVHDGGLLGIEASDDVIVYIARQGRERRFVWRELDAFLDGVEAVERLTTYPWVATLP